MIEVPVEALKEAVENLHGCHATFRNVARVVEKFAGKTVWDGIVHVFDLEGHASAKRAFAWSHELDGSENRRFVAVLESPGIDNPLAAVRAAIVQEFHARANEPPRPKGPRRLPP